MLGLIFKCIKQETHSALCCLFKCEANQEVFHRTRIAALRHDLQLVDVACDARLNVFMRSVFGLVRVWNLLPCEIVHKPSVSSFQTALSQLAKQLREEGSGHWAIRFSPRSSQHILLLQ